MGRPDSISMIRQSVVNENMPELVVALFREEGMETLLCPYWVTALITGSSIHSSSPEPSEHLCNPC